MSIADFDNEEFVKVFRDVVRREILKYQQTPEAVAKQTQTTIKIAERHYPDDIERQIDFHTCFNEIILKSENLGYPKGVCPRGLVSEITKKWNVEGAMIIEYIYARD